MEVQRARRRNVPPAAPAIPSAAQGAAQGQLRAGEGAVGEAGLVQERAPAQWAEGGNGRQPAHKGRDAAAAYSWRGMAAAVAEAARRGA